MYSIDWDIEFRSAGKKYQLALLAECEIISSVDNLTDVATITLPESVMNHVLNFENKIGRGTEVLIRLGYDGNLKTEFEGFIKDIVNNDSSLKIVCEDALFLFRVGVGNIEMKPTSTKQVAQYILDQIDSSYTLNCTYNINYEKFTIYQATGYDVLKKLQSETKAHIFFDTKNKILHLHPPYTHKDGETYYSMQKNIETSSLEFKNKIDTKVEVTIESTNIKGNINKVVRGTTGGDKVTIRVGTMSKESMIDLANEVLKQKVAPAYEGTFDAWLVPFVKPSYSIQIKDEDYADKTAFYYVKAVTTSISESGVKRTITPSLKLT